MIRKRKEGRDGKWEERKKWGEVWGERTQEVVKERERKRGVKWNVAKKRRKEETNEIKRLRRKSDSLTEKGRFSYHRLS